MDDFYKHLVKALYIESEELIPAVKRKSRRRRRIQSIQKQDPVICRPSTLSKFEVIYLSTLIETCDCF